MSPSPKIVMFGGSGAVGKEVIHSLIGTDSYDALLLLGRTPIADITGENIIQHSIDIFDTSTYAGYLTGYTTAICTLGVGEPSRISHEEFVRIDKDAVLDFARACRDAGVQHFEILSSVGQDAQSWNRYLRTKGELVVALEALGFERLSVFEPSMILTPHNRYGITQGIALSIWPYLDRVFWGKAQKYRGIPVSQLGHAIAKNVYLKGTTLERFTWSDFQRINGK